MDSFVVRVFSVESEWILRKQKKSREKKKEANNGNVKLGRGTKEVNKTLLWHLYNYCSNLFC